MTSETLISELCGSLGAIAPSRWARGRRRETHRLEQVGPDRLSWAEAGDHSGGSLPRNGRLLRTPELVLMGFRWASEAARRGTGTFSRGLGRRWVGIFAGGIGVGGRENEPVPGAMADAGGAGSCGGVGCSGCRFDGEMRTSSPLAARLPSPARPAVPNTSDLVAGEGPGVGEHRVVVPAMGCEGLRHWQRDPSSALWAPSPGGGRIR